MKTALKAGIARHGSVDALKEAYTNLVPAEEEHESSTENELGLGPLADWKFELARLAAIVQVPWKNKALQEMNWGFFCAGCDKTGDDEGGCHDRGMFMNERVEEHLRPYED